MEERRKTQRFTVTRLASVSPMEEEHFDRLKVTDISTGGMRFISKKEFAKGATIFFAVEVETDDGIVPIQGEGRVIHAEKNNNDFLIGIEFTYLPDLENEKLQELLLLEKFEASK
ncbi:PilZ domain-containing protein [Spirochaetia bacterium 38H-sp]|uniref:PilZ domain-containing protein n=1 Tax=Rarispira pelagica TaxID=3141764 RepID=A0ABU9UBV8_9SPIR